MEPGQEPNNYGMLKEISVLTNAYKYLLEHVLTLHYEEGIFRLLVIHKGRVLTDLNYWSFKAARISFTRFYNKQKWNEETTPEWSEFYDPVKFYLDLRDNRVKYGF